MKPGARLFSCSGQEWCTISIIMGRFHQHELQRLTKTCRRSTRSMSEWTTLKWRWLWTWVLQPSFWMSSHSNRSTAMTKFLSCHLPNACLCMAQWHTERTVGQFEGIIAYWDNKCATTIHVLKESHGSLLSCKTGTTLGILDIHI